MPHIKICPVAGPYDYGYEFSWQASLEVKKALLLLSTVADFLQVDCQNIDQDDWSTNQDTKGKPTQSLEDLVPRICNLVRKLI